MNHHHYIKRCRNCNKVIEQCRCFGQKEIVWGMCDDCNEESNYESKRNLRIVACCGSCEYFHLSFAYEESYCELFKQDVPYAAICDKYELNKHLKIVPLFGGFSIVETRNE